MRLRNKQTGEIGLVHCDATMFSNKIGVFIDNNHIDLRNPYKVYDSLAELNAEWEDAPEEPKEYWYVSAYGHLAKTDVMTDLHKDAEKIGNLFGTAEEAKLAIRKLKALKRLKDKGFRFEGIKEDYTRILQSQEPFRTGKRYLQFNKSEDEDWLKENWEDLDLVFGGEE